MPPITKTLSITGMTCISCVNHIEGDINHLDGVQDISVNFEKKSAKVLFNSSIISLSDIINRIKKIGFTATELSDSVEQESTQKEQSHGCCDGGKANSSQSHNWMIIACALPILAIVGALYWYCGELSWYWLIVLLCPLMHIFMMKNHH
jgi:copper chaperone CopZ